MTINKSRSLKMHENNTLSPKSFHSSPPLRDLKPV